MSFWHGQTSLREEPLHCKAFLILNFTWGILNVFKNNDHDASQHGSGQIVMFLSHAFG